MCFVVFLIACLVIALIVVGIIHYPMQLILFVGFALGMMLLWLSIVVRDDKKAIKVISSIMGVIILLYMSYLTFFLL